LGYPTNLSVAPFLQYDLELGAMVGNGQDSHLGGASGAIVELDALTPGG